jgi:hypothetical protein
VIARPAVEHHEVLVDDLLDANLVARGKRMARRRDEHELVVVERGDRDVGVLELADEPDLDVLAQHHLEHLLGVAGADDQLDAGVARPEALEDRGQDVRRDGGRAADRELPGRAALDLGEEQAAVGDGVERALRERQEGAAGIGEPRAVAPAHQELRPDIALEILDPSRHRGLGDEQRRRCLADAARSGRGHQGFELGQLHA